MLFPPHRFLQFGFVRREKVVKVHDGMDNAIHISYTQMAFNFSFN